MDYEEYKTCANCEFSSRINFVDNVAIDSWCDKHYTNFTPSSKCDYWERNPDLLRANKRVNH